MGLYKRIDLKKVLGLIDKGQAPPLFVIHGERFLCRQVADELVARFVPDERLRGRCVTVVDGDREDPIQTLNDLKTYGLFPGRKVIVVVDSKIFFSKANIKGMWEKATKAHEARDIRLTIRYLQQVLDLAGMDGAGELADLSDAQWRKVFGFSRPAEGVGWVVEVMETASGPEESQISRGQGKTGVAETYERAFVAGLPEQHCILFLCEAVDKRKSLYKYASEHGIIIDCSVDTGASKAARSDQEALLRELVAETLSGLGKRIDPAALSGLLERVGFHPVAVVREAEKLALYVDDREMITPSDLDALVGRTREEAIFELTEAFTDRDLPRALTLISRVLESGVHPLALVSLLRKHLRKLMLACALRQSSEPAYAEGMTYAVFQKAYLPQLKEVKAELLGELPGHPYALFLLLEKAGRHQQRQLVRCLDELLGAEYRMKSSSTPPALLLENFFFRLRFGGIGRTG